MKPFQFLLLLSFVMFCLSSCIHIDVSEKHTLIKNNEWNDDFVPNFKFHINDTTYKYKIFIIIKHLHDFEFQNLWIDFGVQPPEDSLHFIQTNIQLSHNEKGWLGSGFSNVYERRFLWKTIQFKKIGDYNFAIHQIMRVTPLQGISSIGIRLEK